MDNPVLAWIVEENRWLPLSMALAGLAVAALIVRNHRRRREGADVALAALCLGFAVTIGTMGLGHLLAVSVLQAFGRLEGTPAVLWPIGLAVAAPAWWLAVRAWHLAVDGEPRRRTLALTAWMVATLVVLGLHNLPLAGTGLLALAYALVAHPAWRRAVLVLAVAGNLALFAGALIFMASGQSFEEFRGIE